MKAPASIHPETRVWRRKELDFEELDGDVLMLDAQAGYAHSLLGPGRRIWELIHTPQTVALLCAQLRREYAVDEETCLADVAALLAKLRAAGLVSTADES